MKTDCAIIRDLLPLYAEHVTSPASTALVEEHLKECPACRKELEQMQQPIPVQTEPQTEAPLQQVKKTLRRKQLFSALAAVAVLACIVLGLYVWYAWSPVVTFEEAGVELVDADPALTPNPKILRVTGKNVRFHIVGTTVDDDMVLSAERYSSFYLWWNDLLDAHFRHVRHDTSYYPVSTEQEYHIVCKDTDYYCINGVLTQE